MTNDVWIVFDLGFGDAGKGATVDFLVRDRQANLVVRYNGGAQAGHNVVTPDGRHHTFSQFGAGTFVEGTKTLLGPAFVMHPGALLVEAAHLESVGINDALARTSVDEQALVISPFQQAAGRLRELQRGDCKHGTCGVGVGEAVKDSLSDENGVIRAGDLANVDTLFTKLELQRRRKQAEFAQAAEWDDPASALEIGLLRDQSAVERTLDLWRSLPSQLRVLPSNEARKLIQQTRTVVFEGAQGILLDQDRGFHPHTTWSDCTPGGATRLLEGGRSRVFRIGVLRSYMVRHGPGPFPTRSLHFDQTHPEYHNDAEGWQGQFRSGPLDLVLLRYALEVCDRADGLAVTCLDRTADSTPVCFSHELDGERRTRIPPPVAGDHLALNRLASDLERSRPIVEYVDREDLVASIERQLGIPVVLTAHGPTATDRCWRQSPAELLLHLPAMRPDGVVNVETADRRV